MGSRSVLRVLFDAVFTEPADPEVERAKVLRLAEAKCAHRRSMKVLREARLSFDTRPDDTPRAYAGTFVDLHDRIAADDEAMLEALGGD